MTDRQKESRTFVVSAALTEKEREDFRAIAKAEGTDVSNLLRRLVRGRIAEHALHSQAA